MTETRVMIRFMKLAAVSVLATLVILVAVPVQAQEEDIAGEVLRLQGAAVAMQDAFPRPLKIGDKIMRGDVISTGKDARIEIRMIDDAVMTLGERTVFVVIDYITTGEEPNAAVRLLEGAFKAVSGDLVKTANASFVVETPLATIGIRGTTFWGGSLDGVFEVALLDGKGIYVETKTGRVELTTVGQGTAIRSADIAPTAPEAWGAGKVQRAVDTVTFK